MAAKDIFHNQVKNALIKEGWKITDDPLTLSYGGRNVFVDLGAEYLGAQKEGRKIAVEIKSFISHSDVHDLGISIGQYRIYRNILSEIEPEREIYLAVPTYAYDGIFQEPLGQLMIKKDKLLLQRGGNQSSVVILSEAKNLLFGGPEILRFAQNDKLKSGG